MTTYTLAQRRSLVRTFKKVLKALPSTVVASSDAVWMLTSPYICDNIHRVAISRVAANLAQDLINDRINGKFSVDGWLRARHPEVAQELRDDVNNNQGRRLQAYRKAWLESLITEFEA